MKHSGKLKESGFIIPLNLAFCEELRYIYVYYNHVGSGLEESAPERFGVVPKPFFSTKRHLPMNNWDLRNSVLNRDIFTLARADYNV